MNEAYRRAGMIAFGGIGLGTMLGMLTVYSMTPLPSEIPYAEYTPQPIQFAPREVPIGIIDQGNRPGQDRYAALLARRSADTAQPAASRFDEAAEMSAAVPQGDAPVASDDDQQEPAFADDPTVDSDVGSVTG